ncbi:type II toxin-antitoxin system RelE/ParE family toxin [Amphibiibacter pelophylacis]|uniref:Type II toxin-antitoxin system RelE/ParE family toxin n=1 Tax=Amphibiibacter pelophylacis TaxID=1799477 RepID=A0ACC6NYX1_9BURK
MTSNFERNLMELDIFLAQAQACQAFDALLDEQTHTVIPNLELFPAMGRLFLAHQPRSVEVANGITRLKTQLSSITPAGELREYVMTHYLVLYAQGKDTVFLLSIRHQKQLSFDFKALWAGS